MVESGGGYNSAIATLKGADGMTLLYQGNADDNFIQSGAFGFPFQFYNQTFTTTFISSNSYLTFGQGSSAYSGLSTTNPPLKGLHVSSADRSYQRAYGAQENGTYRVRYEGSVGTSGTAGNPSNVWEVTLYPDNTLMLVTGVLAPSGQSFITDGGTQGSVNSQSFAAQIQSNTSFVFQRLSDTQYLIRLGSYG